MFNSTNIYHKISDETSQYSFSEMAVFLLFFYAIQWRVTDPFVWFNLFLIHFINLDAAAVALRRTLANDLHRRVFWSHRVCHRVVNTYFCLVRTRSTEFYLAAADRNEIPRRCAPAKIPFRGPRLAGAWLNWRSVAGIRSSLQRIEFLSQLSTRSLVSVRLRTSPGPATKIPWQSSERSCCP